eukprot:CFRG6325T1
MISSGSHGLTKNSSTKLTQGHNIEQHMAPVLYHMRRQEEREVTVYINTTGCRSLIFEDPDRSTELRILLS